MSSNDPQQLLEACRREGTKVKDLVPLLDSGIPVDYTSKAHVGWTGLHYAAEIGNLPVAQFLVEKGATVNKESEGSWTPLLNAVRNSQYKMVEYLVSVGADPNIRTKQGLTPIGAAGKNQELLALLEGYCSVKPAKR
mmetsp:Transcript_18837/g.25985  ORF Transcript_18837/g.25985 Transcript_18837/m.25985 type:complete len:137 (+) Transcript_18837:136-546(+)|eukprot:CAMPEP_0201477968 /NCGR_PEP_ID=MMETSP0151_2-20130828/2903_1 /ASSEMBLY_ACC=CAM_ASM_000257 /TAXON_ID=200890 /ORGANISM="Paramoeba atlantica, Strain 621/1 / CCAP 1560/9" /LENGTH=136 /DNA_ID=CAMNT_0047858869 /DNA_START=73 /DNA_END=483 /DNA_ORIENTATION=-